MTAAAIAVHSVLMAIAVFSHTVYDVGLNCAAVVFARRMPRQRYGFGVEFMDFCNCKHINIYDDN